MWTFTEDAWDTFFFKRKMGKLHFERQVRSPGFPSRAILKAGLETTLGLTQQLGFRHVVCRLHESEAALQGVLKAAGFKLYDEGVTCLFHDRANRRLEKPSRRVRLAHREEIPMINRFAAASFVFSHFYRNPFFKRKEVDRYHAQWVRNIFKKPEGRILIVEEKGRPIAFLAYDYDAKDKKVKMLLQATDPKFRGQGIATELLKGLLVWGRARRVRLISSRMNQTNQAILRVHQKLGFKRDFEDATFCRTL